MMDSGSAPSPIRLRKPRSHHPDAKLNRLKAAQLADAGLGCADIAKHQGVSKQAAWAFLERYQIRKPAVAHFRSIRADILAGLQADNLDLQARVLDSMGRDGIVEALTQQAKTGLLFALNAQHGTLFDKERLERGESTSNHSVMSTMLGNSVKQLYATPTKPPTRKRKAQADSQADGDNVG